MATVVNTEQLWQKQAVPPANPSTGNRKLYPSVDGYWYTIDEAGIIDRFLMDSELGVTVEPYDATILKSADIGVTVEPYDATILKSADIGLTVEPYSADIVNPGAQAAQGDLLYGSAAGVWSRLAKSATAQRVLTNGGTNNNPIWQQVNLTNGVTGTLPPANFDTVITYTTTGSSYLTPGGSGLTIVRCNNASALTILGLSGSPADGQIVIIVSVGAGDVFLKHNNVAGQSDFNNWVTSVNMPLSAGSGIAIYVYDGTTQRWRMVNYYQGSPLSFTPTWTATGTNPTVGNGSLSGTYLIRGRRCVVSYSLVFGSTTNPGVGQWIFSLPINQSGQGNIAGTAIKTGTIYITIAFFISASTTQFFSQAVPAYQPTVPFTWANGDQMSVVGEYPIT